MSKGEIYILTNPSFPWYVKIGYADKEVEQRLTDLKLYALIDRLNPNLCSIDEADGKKQRSKGYGSLILRGPKNRYTKR